MVSRSRSIDKAAQRVVDYRRKMQATKKEKEQSSKRANRIAGVDLEVMRKLADERVAAAQREAAERHRKIIHEAEKKKQDVVQRRNREATEKTQRRAEIYALNAIMSEIASRQFQRMQVRVQESH